MTTGVVNPGGVRAMLAIALPMVVSQACDTFMVFIDRLFLAHIDEVLMNAAMAGGLTSFMFSTFLIGLSGYSTALVAQYLGAGREDRCGTVLTQAALICLVGYPLLVALRPLGHLLFTAVDLSPEQLAAQGAYFDILVGGSIIGLGRHVLACFFSGLGRTRMVMLSSLVAMVVNVVANYGLIFGAYGLPALGISGAAYGTLIGHGAGLLILLGIVLMPAIRRRYGVLTTLRFDAGIMRTLLRKGTPGGLEFLLNLIAFDLLILTFHGHGLTTGVATTVVFNWDMVSFVPLVGVNIAVTSLVGRFMGAGDPDTAHAATMSGLRVAWFYGALTLIAFACFPGYLVDVFRPAEHPAVFDEARPLAIAMLRLAAFYVLADATLLVFSGALRGAGDTFWAMVISVSFHWTVVPVLMFLLNVAGWQPLSAWMVLIAVILCFAGLFWLRYHCGRWRNMQVLEPAG